MVIGFRPDVYTVSESDGQVSLSVTRISGSFGSEPISVELELSTVDGTAQGKTKSAWCMLHNQHIIIVVNSVVLSSVG